MQTGHPGSRATSYFVHGNLVSAADLPGAKQVDHWYQISAIDVLSVKGAASIVALGDSITDGHGATTNGNDRWTDVLAARLQTSRQTRNIGVSNQGIGGNHLLTDGLGPNALARFDRDVLAQAGVRWLIVFEGVNDLGGLARTGEVSQAEHATRAQRVRRSLRTDHRARSRPRHSRFRRDHHPVCRLGLLSSGAAERSRPPGGQ